MRNKIANWFPVCQKLVEDIDTLFNTKAGLTGILEGQESPALFYSAFGEMMYDYLYQKDDYPADALRWDNLPIWVSSYVVHFPDDDSQAIWAEPLRLQEIFNKYVQYLAWVKKIMTDDGVAKSIVISRNLRDSGNNSTESKDSYSETPQLGQVDFDEDMLDYRSNFDKGNSSSSYMRATVTDVTTRHKSWDEEMKNLRMVYMSEITEYTRKIPYLIYSAYALDTMPFPDIICEYVNSIRSLYEQR